jgi:prepilin-type N-terminal cleavage/methylation domain-containing protein
MPAGANSDRRGRRPGGFTLVEVMIAVTLCALLTGAALTSFTFTLQGERSLANYSEMNAKARKMLEQVGRDLRSAGDVPAGGYSSTSLQILVPSDTTGNNWQTVTWAYNAIAGTFTRTLAGSAAVTYATNITSFNFKYYNNNGVAPTSDVDLKQVQLSMSMQRYLTTSNAASTSEYVISAQFTLRSKSTTI